MLTSIDIVAKLGLIRTAQSPEVPTETAEEPRAPQEPAQPATTEQPIPAEQQLPAGDMTAPMPAGPQRMTPEQAMQLQRALQEAIAGEVDVDEEEITNDPALSIPAEEPEIVPVP